MWNDGVGAYRDSRLLRRRQGGRHSRRLCGTGGCPYRAQRLGLLLGPNAPVADTSRPQWLGCRTRYSTVPAHCEAADLMAVDVSDWDLRACMPLQPPMRKPPRWMMGSATLVCKRVQKVCANVRMPALLAKDFEYLALLAELASGKMPL